MPLKGAKTKLATFNDHARGGLAGMSGDGDGSMLELSVSDIAPDPRQPRKSFLQADHDALVISIKAHGVLQPIAVRPGTGQGKAARWLIVAGERRWRAAKAAGLQRIPAIVRERDPDVLALIENLHRVDPNPIEEAEALARLKEKRGLTLQQLAEVAGKHPSTVSEILKLAGLPGDIKAALRIGASVPCRALVEIARLKEPVEQLKAFAEVRQGTATAESLRANREPQRLARKGRAQAKPIQGGPDTKTSETYPEPRDGRTEKLRRAVTREPAPLDESKASRRNVEHGVFQSAQAQELRRAVTPETGQNNNSRSTKKRPAPEGSSKLRRAVTPAASQSEAGQAWERLGSLAQNLEEVLQCSERTGLASLSGHDWAALRSRLMRLQATISNALALEEERRAGHAA